MLRTLAGAVVTSAIFAGQPPPGPGEPALGIAGLKGPYGVGWGAAQPLTIFNGGVPNGMAYFLVWEDWGAPVATATGSHPAYRPTGGYYRRRVNIELKALRLGECRRAPGRPAYTRLIARSQVRPDGPWGDWFPWTLDLCDRDARPKRCGRVVVAFRITAWDTGCRAARRVARASRRISPASSRPAYRLRSGRFVCNGDRILYERPRIHWRCARGSALVEFERL